MTLLDLVTTVEEYAGSEADVIAIVARLVNSGTVRLGGNFKGARFDGVDFAQYGTPAA
jgi:hypothetical protein